VQQGRVLINFPYDFFMNPKIVFTFAVPKMLGL
jgi:hypothetical protein